MLLFFFYLNIKFTLRDISRFSLPQINIPSSYEPISKKNSRSTENNPPTIQGSRNAAALSLFTLFHSRWGIGDLKTKS